MPPLERLLQLQAGISASAYGAPPMAANTMSYWLAVAAKQLREAAERKQVHIAAGADVDQSTVWRFEKQKTFPRDINAVVDAYAEDLDTQPIEIWAHALELWRASQLADAEALEQDEEAAIPPGAASGPLHVPSAQIPRRKRKAP